MSGESIRNNNDPWLLNQAIIAATHNFDLAKFSGQSLNVLNDVSVMPAPSLQEFDETQQSEIIHRYTLLDVFRRQFADVARYIIDVMSKDELISKSLLDAVVREHPDLGATATLLSASYLDATIVLGVGDQRYDLEVASAHGSAQRNTSEFVERCIRGALAVRGLPGRWRGYQAISYENGALVSKHLEGEP